MAYEKLKSESYQLLGGMNNKASPYNNTVNEFRELTNFQFSQPGSIDKRPGTTLYCQGSSTKILGLYEFNRLNGSSYLLFNDSAGLWKTSPSGNTFIGGYTIGAAFQRSGIVGATLTSPGNTGGKADFVTLQDWSVISFNGQTLNSYNNSFNIRKTDGFTLFLYGLPRPARTLNYASGFSLTTFNVGGRTGGSMMAGVTGTFRVTTAYINNRGFIGPAMLSYNDNIPGGEKYVTKTISGTASDNSLILDGIGSALGPTFSNGSIFNYVGISYGRMYGVSAIAIFCSLPNQTVPFYYTQIGLNTQTFIITDLVGLSDIPANDYGRFNFGQNNLSITDFDFNQFYAASFAETFQNRLILSGFIGAGIDESIAYGWKAQADIYKSIIVYTDFVNDDPEFEALLPENYIEVRTNDGDEITGLKSYNNALVITKNNSIHQLNGTDPDNFTLNQVTDVYGCVNNRAMIIFNDLLWMLDRKGIAQFNGANTFIVSIKMDDVFARMNYKAAQKEACALYVKEYNQVWFCFPVDNSEVNNMIVMFDIITNEWSKFEGIKPSVLAMAQGTLSKREPFFGGYSGGIFHFGASFMNDYGASGMTCLFQTPYYAPTGHTTERQFRRFYLDVDPVTGASTPIQLKFLPNFGETVGHTASIYQTPFQSRIDFGIPAKSLSVQGLHFSATLPLKINGYTFESRFQRSV